MTTRELDEAAEKFIRSQGAEPAFKGYRGFPGSICASPNSMVVHGIPGPYKLSARRHHLRRRRRRSSTAGSPTPRARSPVGPVTPVAHKLLDATEESLFDAVEQCRPGNRLGDVSHADPGARRGRRALGRALAGRPRDRPRDARGPADPQLRRARHAGRARGGHGPGRRADGHRRAPRGPHGRRHWAIYSQDGSLAAHFEFTIAITADGPADPHPWHEAGNGRADGLLASEPSARLAVP